MADLVERMRGFGTTIFAEMTALATSTGSVNLGQGFPDYPGPAPVLDAASRAIAEGRNQYPPGRGVPELRLAVAEHQRRWYGLEYDPDAEVLVTAGATEAITAAVLALCEPGDEVIALEPTYDSYGAAVALARGVLVPVRLDAPHFRLDADRLAAAVSPRTRLVILNSPHNPTGRVLDADELAAVADLARERHLVVIADEVYEHLTFDDARHLPLAALPGMQERTISISSAGKTFSVTGWKIGWVCSTPRLLTAVTTVKQFLTYAGGTPFQHGVAAGLALPDAAFAAIRDSLRASRDLLLPGLEAAGFDVLPTQGSYFVNVDAAPLGYPDSLDFCRRLPGLCGVVAIPTRVFYTDPAGAESLVRFAFCKRPDVLAEASQRLATLRNRRP